MRAGLKPLNVVQPEGPSFSVDGNEVAWQKWSFRVSFNYREGLVLHNVGCARLAWACPPACLSNHSLPLPFRQGNGLRCSHLDRSQCRPSCLGTLPVSRACHAWWG